MVALIIPVAYADTGTGSIELTSSRKSLPADGKSITTINAIVRDSDGNLVPDNTEVTFNTSLGIIEDSAFTSSGVARVKLTSSDIVGRAVITATWIEGRAVSQIEVNMLSEQAAQTDRRYITVNADHYMIYAIDMKVMYASGGATARINGMTISGHTVQVDLLKNRILAEGLGKDNPVKVALGNETIEGDMYSSDLSGSSGVMISSDRGVEIMDTSTGQFKVSKSDNMYTADLFETFDTSESMIHVESKEAIIYPGEKIYFKSAAISPRGKKIFKLPYYQLSLTGYQPDGSQYIGYSSTGVSISLPYNYSLTPSFSGALMLKYGNRSGWSQYGQVPGWYIDLRQDYNTANSQGSLVFSEITSSEWGAHLSHSQSFGENTQANLYIDYPSHQDLFGTLNISRSFPRFSMGLDLDGNRDRYGNDSSSYNVSLQTKSRRIGKTKLSFNLSAAIGRSRYEWGAEEDTAYVTNTNTERVNANFTTSPISLASNLKLRSSLGIGYQWQDSTDGNGDLSGASTIASSVLDWDISKHNSIQLSYKYIQKPLYSRTYIDGSTVDTKPANQTLSANWRYGDPSKFMISVYGIKGLDYPNMSIFSNISYRLSSQWRLGLRTTSNTYRIRAYENGQFVMRDKTYDDLEIVVGKRLGDQEIAAVWSKSDGRILLQLGSGGY